MVRKLSDEERKAGIKAAQAKYDQKRKKLAVSVDNETAAKIEAHYKQKGFTSANSYLKHLIELDMQGSNLDIGNTDREIIDT